MVKKIGRKLGLVAILYKIIVHNGFTHVPKKYGTPVEFSQVPSTKE